MKRPAAARGVEDLGGATVGQSGAAGGGVDVGERGLGPWSYNTIRVPSSTADAMSAYGIARQARPEEFVFYERSCSNFAADVLGAGGFRGFTPTNQTGASGLWQNWSNFAPAFNDARNMAYSAGFWSSAHMTTPHEKCAAAN